MVAPGICRMGSVVVNKASKRGVIAAAIAGMALVSWPSKAPAADKWWDPTGNAAGTGGTGNWDTTSSFWSTNSAGTSVTTWSNTNDAANFNAVGTLTLTTAISARGLFFDTGSSGTAIGGNT